MMTPGEVIEPGQLALSGLGRELPAALGPGFRLSAEGVRVVDLERDMLLQPLDRSTWTITAAARLLGISRDTVRYRMHKHGLLRPS